MNHNLKTLVQGVERREQRDLEKYKAEHKKKTFEEIAKTNAQEVCKNFTPVDNNTLILVGGRSHLQLLFTLCTK